MPHRSPPDSPPPELPPEDPAGSSGFEPDPRALRWGWMLWVVWLVVGGELLLRDLRDSDGPAAISVVLVAPLWLIWVVWLLWRLWRRIGPAPHRRWHGSWFEFDGRQMRVLFEGDAVLLAADDVFDVFGLQGHARDAERVRGIAGRDGLVRRGGTGMRETLFFTERALRAWLERRTEMQAGKFIRWYETQVILPYRRRREFEGAGERGDR